MRGIGRALAAVLLTGAVAGAAAFAHGLGGAPETTGSFAMPALPPAPSAPLAVEASSFPPVAVTHASPLAGLTRRPVAAGVAGATARPIAIVAIPRPSAHPHAPLAAAPVVATPAATVQAAPAPPAQPAPVAAPVAAPAPAARTTAAVAPAAPTPTQAAVPDRQGEGHDKAKHDNGNGNRKNDKAGKHDAAILTTLAAVPIDAGSAAAQASAPPPVDPASTATADPTQAADALPDDGHGHGHGHDKGRGN
jgi:hypothetical protein